MALHASPPSERSEEEISIRPEFAQPGELQSVPRFRLADRTLPAQTAYQLVHDELLLDGNSRLNLATFVGTWMEPQARVLIEECLDKNIVDRDESPQTAELELRCVSILAELWNSPQAERATGCSTTGSSEACMLGGLALKWRWRERRRAAGKPTDRPNLVMGANVQVCWEKFCRYWDVEPRRMALEPGRTCLTADGAIALCDENTIGVLAILGSTFDGAYEPVSELAGALDSLQGRDRHGYPDPRRRGLRWFRRALPRPRARVGLPSCPRAVDQRLGTQVRPRVSESGLGGLARKGRATG